MIAHYVLFLIIFLERNTAPDTPELDRPSLLILLQPQTKYARFLHLPLSQEEQESVTQSSLKGPKVATRGILYIHGKYQNEENNSLASDAILSAGSTLNACPYWNQRACCAHVAETEEQKDT